MDNCIICGKPVPNYEPVMCCSGRDCGCLGLPDEPPFCSKECEDKIYGRVTEQTKDTAKG